MVVMDDVSEAHSRLSNPPQVSVPQAHLMRFQQLVHEMHDEGLFHGDIRHPNVLVRKDINTNPDLCGGLLLVDFDWGGKESETRYPGDLNPDVPRHDAITDEALIQSIHDRYMLDILFPVHDST